VKVKRHSSNEEKMNFLEKKIRLGEDMDAVLERCFIEHKDLSSALDVVFKCIDRHLKPMVMFLRTLNEDLIMTTYSNGVFQEILRKTVSELFQISKPTKISSPGLEWFAIPLDMAGETVGTMGFAFSSCEAMNDEDDIFELMNVVAEELDSYFYSIQENRRKHQFILETQDALRCRVLPQAIDSAVTTLLDAVSVQELLILYMDEDLIGKPKIQYHFFRENQKIFDSFYAPMDALDTAIEKEGNRIFSRETHALDNIWSIDDNTETVVMESFYPSTPVGMLLVRSPEGGGFSIGSRELIQVFSESIRYRLLDFNREKHMLRHHFSPKATRKLLSIKDYFGLHLSPKAHEIGIIVAGISGFAKICDQVLKQPCRIVDFIDKWSSEIVEAIFQEDGALDRIVGDSVIGLFGPPFYNFEITDVATKLIRTSLKIRELTKNLINAPEYANIRLSDDYRNFGIAIGINICSANIALIGPNKDLAVFGRGMTETTFLQTTARTGEISATISVKDLAEKSHPGFWRFEGPIYIDRKNTDKPLISYKLLL